MHLLAPARRALRVAFGAAFAAQDTTWPRLVRLGSVAPSDSALKGEDGERGWEMVSGRTPHLHPLPQGARRRLPRWTAGPRLRRQHKHDASRGLGSAEAQP